MIDLDKIPNFDNWKLADGQEEYKVVDMCNNCRGEIYTNDWVCLSEGNFIVHEECFIEYAMLMLSATSKQIKE